MRKHDAIFGWTHIRILRIVIVVIRHWLIEIIVGIHIHIAQHKVTKVIQLFPPSVIVHRQVVRLFPSMGLVQTVVGQRTHSRNPVLTADHFRRARCDLGQYRLDVGRWFVQMIDPRE